jgi:RND superfamily putative drug exporter
MKDVRLTPQAREAAIFGSDLVGPIILPLHAKGSQSEIQAIDQELRERLAADQSVKDPVRLRVLGQGALWTAVKQTFKQDLSKAELVGVPLLAVALLLIFGSFAAAMLPIALGIGTVIITGLLIYGLSLVMQLSIFVTNTASLIGLGVAVDYSLILLTRVRQELAAGHSLAEAQSITLLTSGRAVIYSGLTVMTSLSGLWLIPNNTAHSMTVGAILAVFVAVSMAVTLLPALIWALGAQRTSSQGVRERLARTLPPFGLRGVSWERWSRSLSRRPVLPMLAATTLLLLLCIPALSMRTSTGALRQLGPRDETHIAFEEAASVNGPGDLGPLYVVATARRVGAALETRVEPVREAIERLGGVKALSATHISPDGRYAMFTIAPNEDPESPRAMNLVRRVRALLRSDEQRIGISAEVGGASAVEVDQEQQIAANMWKAIVAVLVLAFVVLTVLLRSLVLPLKAVVMNLLSVGAAYGVLVVIFQWGWSDSLLHFHSLGYLETLTPPLILAIVFGLSMDYEIFLLSRIREQWVITNDTETAVARGLAASARMISNAAILLVCVFAIFVGTGVASVKEVGLGGAIAIGLDATIVRLVLVPTLMVLLGRWNWWLPKSLERLLPAR